MGKVWGGYRLYSGMSNKDAIHTAFHEFVQNNEKDPKAAIILNHEQAVGGLAGFMIFFFYDGEKPPKGAFGKFEDIKPTIDLVKVRAYDELVYYVPKLIGFEQDMLTK